MRHVYQKSQIVHAWLGKDSFDAKISHELFQTYDWLCHDSMATATPLSEDAFTDMCRQFVCLLHSPQSNR